MGKDLSPASNLKGGVSFLRDILTGGSGGGPDEEKRRLCSKNRSYSLCVRLESLEGGRGGAS